MRERLLSGGGLSGAGQGAGQARRRSLLLQRLALVRGPREAFLAQLGRALLGARRVVAGLVEQGAQVVQGPGVLLAVICPCSRYGEVMSTSRLRHTARALLLDDDDRILLARHDLTSWQGLVVWAPPGGGLEPGETPVDAVVRELMEEVGHEASADEVRHVWHQEVVSDKYAKGWDGAIHDYFVIRCESLTAKGTWTTEQLAGEDITEFRWWALPEMDAVTRPEVFSPRQLPSLLRDLVGNPVSQYPICL